MDGLSPVFSHFTVRDASGLWNHCTALAELGSRGADGVELQVRSIPAEGSLGEEVRGKRRGAAFVTPLPSNFQAI